VFHLSKQAKIRKLIWLGFLLNTIYSPIIKEAVDSVSQIMGLPRSHILPMKNYESEMELDDGVNTLALMTLLQVLRFMISLSNPVNSHC
jgi:hypothetical protein